MYIVRIYTSVAFGATDRQTQPDRDVGGKVLGTKGASIDVRGLDMLDETPILDIKPHVEGPRI